MTIRVCDICGAKDEEGINIRTWRPQEKYLFRDYCPACLAKTKQKYRDEGWTQKDGYDI